MQSSKLSGGGVRAVIMVRGVFGTLGELVQFLWSSRRWWLIPVVMVLALFAIVAILGSVSGVGPFIYTLF